MKKFLIFMVIVFTIMTIEYMVSDSNYRAYKRSEKSYKQELMQDKTMSKTEIEQKMDEFKKKYEPKEKGLSLKDAMKAALVTTGVLGFLVFLGSRRFRLII